MNGFRFTIFTGAYIKNQCIFPKAKYNEKLPNIRRFSTTNMSNAKFVQFCYKDNPCEIRCGYISGANVVDVQRYNPALPCTLLELLQKKCICDVYRIMFSSPLGEPLDGVILAAPITGMDKVLCVGLNYSDHCMEQRVEPPKIPMIFSKFASTVIGPSQPVKIRPVTKNVDWEVELVVVIGCKCTDVRPSEALNYVFGYTIGQDITSRDWQKKNGGQFLLGKSQDTFCPIGPWIVTADEIQNPHDLAISCAINGFTRQNSHTSCMIHKIPNIISRLSSVMTLLPGDIILTGTPGGVGQYYKPPMFLKAGDKLINVIQHIGCLEVNIDAD